MPKSLSIQFRSRTRRRLRALAPVSACLVASAFIATAAQAQTAPTRECIDAHANGQVARGQGQLLQAQSYFLSCAVEICPQIIRDDCARFGAEVQAALPSVIVVAQSSSGRPASSASVQVDASPEAVPVDGRAVSVDPGQHVFKVRAADGSEASVTTQIRDAEKDRRVVVLLAPPATSTSDGPGTTQGRKISPLVYVFGGVGLLAAGSFTYFALDGKSRENTMNDCKPGCDPDDVSKMRRSYLLGDVSLGVAVASLGLGAYFLARPPTATASRGFAMRSLSLSTSPELGAVRVSASAAF